MILKIKDESDRLAAAAILVKNGYTVRQERYNTETPGKSKKYAWRLVVEEES